MTNFEPPTQIAHVEIDRPYGESVGSKTTESIQHCGARSPASLPGSENANNRDGIASFERSSNANGTGITVKQLRQMIVARRARETLLGVDLFGDPAWDILLVAFQSDLAQERVSVSALCSAAAVPATTALRWINKLEEDGWLLRECDKFDGRRQWIMLTSQGSAALSRYFDAVSTILLPI